MTRSRSIQPSYRAAVALSSRYITGRQLPDKAVDVLDTSAAYVNLLRNAPEFVFVKSGVERIKLGEFVAFNV